MKTAKILTILVLALGLMVWSGQEALGGTLEAWGSNDSGQCDVPAGSDFVAVAGGGEHSLAVKSDGSLAAWGNNSLGQCDVPAGNDLAAIAAGANHSLAVKSDGSLVAWGRNDLGQCDVPAGTDFIAVAGGYLHSLALKSDGSLAAWGFNGSGQCDVPAGTDFVAVSAGDHYSLALKSDGSLAAWGANTYGQCTVPSGSDFVAIAAGRDHGVALKSDGSLAAWGDNRYGQCNNVPAGTDFVAVAAGVLHSLALKSDGSLAAWGANNYGQCDVPSGNDFVGITAGLAHSLAVSGSLMGTAFTYQGRLNDGNSPADGLYDFEFKLYDNNDPCTGLQKGSTIDVNEVDVIDGDFMVEVDFGSSIFTGYARWLQVGVRAGDSNDAYTTLSPRQEVKPTPYALHADTAAYAQTAGYAQSAGGTPGGISGSGTANYIAKFTGPNTIGDSVLYESAGNIGIGTTSPAEKVEVAGNVKVDGSYLDSSADAGTSGQILSSTGSGTNWMNPPSGGDSDWVISGNDMYSGVSGNVGIGTTSPSAKLDVVGSNGGPVIKAISDSNTAVYGKHTSFTETGYGVHGDSNKGLGVYGTNADRTWGGLGGISYGVYGRSYIDNAYGVVGTGLGANSTGVVGHGTRYGVEAWGDNPDSTGLYAKGGSSGYAADFVGNVIVRDSSSASTVIKLGEGPDYVAEFEGSIKATATSPDGNGVRGLSDTGRGVHGLSDTGKGVAGYSNTGYGLYGYSREGNGVRGSSPNGYAGAFMGYVRITKMSGIPLGASVVWDGTGNGELGFGISSARFKEDIEPFSDDFHKILKAEPKSFTAKGRSVKGIGFIAEEFDELGLSHLLIYQDGSPLSIRYELISLYLLEVVKDQVETTKELKAENDSLKQRVEALERTIHQLAKVKEVEL